VLIHPRQAEQILDRADHPDLGVVVVIDLTAPDVRAGNEMPSNGDRRRDRGLPRSP